MRIVILTQNESNYLPVAIKSFLDGLPTYVEVSGAVVFKVSPFGKSESFLKKVLKVYKTFGFNFFVRFSSKFILSKIFGDDVLKVLRKSKVKIIKLKHSVNHKTSLNRINELNPDLLISITANEIFKKKLIELAPLGCINLHSSLLPKNRGLFPTFWALKNGDKETGISVFFVDEGIDSGQIVVQIKIPIKKRNLEWLIKEAKIVGVKGLLQAIEKIHENNFTLLNNDATYATYNTFPEKKDVDDFIKNGNSLY